MNYGPYSRSETNRGALASTIAVVALAAFLLITHQQCTWPFRQAVEPVAPQPLEPKEESNDEEARVIKGSYLVVVEESQGRPFERIKVLNDYDFWFSLRDRGLKGFRLLDPDSPDSASFVAAATKRKIDPPFVMHVSSAGKVLRAIPFPNSTAKIEAMLK